MPLSSLTCSTLSYFFPFSISVPPLPFFGSCSYSILSNGSALIGILPISIYLCLLTRITKEWKICMYYHEFSSISLLSRIRKQMY
ncbi:hypothetical protein Csa_018274 [Cucumis sativus]|uniref:Uncharacterized protein n=1 Tax=Cucumis sativus TaxID=3659 RepID=A0A0A0KDN4_CUCSA|nr:hypothetical protein Csa_018274 [Cucumis sativus]